MGPGEKASREQIQRMLREKEQVVSVLLPLVK